MTTKHEACAALVDTEAPVMGLPTVQPRGVGVLAYLAFATICLVWGTTFLAIRVAIETIPTLVVTSVRFLSAGVLLLGVALLTRARFPRSTVVWRDQIVSGVLMAGAGNTLVVYAEHALTSGLAALFSATIPIWMAVMESLLGYDRMTPRKIFGLILGFGGVGLLVAPEMGRPDLSGRFLLAVAATQLSAIAWNSGTLISRRSPDGSDAMARAAVQMLAGGTAVTVVALFFGPAPARSMFTLRSTLAVAYLAVFGSVIAYTAYAYAHSRLSAGRVSSYAYVNPAVAVVVGALMLSEPVTPIMIGAMLMILAGVMTIQLSRQRLIRLVTRPG
jgi:drug/metabolite transporter (DMT)-like permease